MKPINTSFYDFDRIIEGGYVYVYVGVNYDPAARTIGEVKTSSVGRYRFGNPNWRRENLKTHARGSVELVKGQFE